MAKRVAVSMLNASTIDILNTIRANASAEYQASIPEVAVETDIPKVGETLWGYPALANQFINALINRIAAVRIKSATFNNAYAELKKGYLEFGETVEEVFVAITKAREFSVEKAESREFKRSMPDVKAAFHVMNWRVQYPITIQQEDLRMAFQSMEGVQDLIARIVDAVYTAAEYDEYLLFKYLIIKAVSHGNMYPVAVDTTDIDNAAIAFRGNSNQLTFMSNKYNEAGVTTTTPKADQFIFMDSTFNAQYDVKVLAAAFNMDKADFSGRLKLIDDFTTFDNDRFSDIRAGSDQIEEVTADELALMAHVKAVLVDREWFQVYDNLTQFTEKYVANGLYWNYFYNVWKTVSSSPFSNAIVFVDNTADVTAPATLTAEIVSKDQSEEGVTLGFVIHEDDATLAPINMGGFQYVAVGAVANLVALQYYGMLTWTADHISAGYTLKYVTPDGTSYSTAAAAMTTSLNVGDTVTFTKVGVTA